MLVHEQPVVCARLALRILESDCDLVLHVDAKTPDSFLESLQIEMGEQFTRLKWAERVKVQWGGWSVVEAMLNGLRIIESHEINPHYVYLLSGADYPIRPLRQLKEFLAVNEGQEFIEAHDAERTEWVVGGFQTGRYRYRHWLNWAKHPHLFTLLHRAQEVLGLERSMPAGLEPRIGSQWWVLTWATCREVLRLAHDREIIRFFKTTWVPDELFFQTLVVHVVGSQGKIDGRTLTHYIFSESGMPLEFYNGQHEYLARQPFFFARKLSPLADELRDNLDVLALAGTQEMPDDESLGKATSDYADFRAASRNRLDRGWRWGRVGKTSLGSLARSARVYNVVSATCAEYLDGAREALPEHSSINLHGRLFAPDRISFSRGRASVLGFRSADVALRDQDRQAFLYDILNSPESGTPLFFVLEGVDDIAEDGPGLLTDIVGNDPNANWIRLVDGEPSEPVQRGTDTPAPGEGSRRDIVWHSGKAEQALLEALRA